MTLERLGPAVLLVLSVAASSAAQSQRIAQDEAADEEVTAEQERTRNSQSRARATAQTGSTVGSPVFARGGDWARAEAAALVGNQLVNQDLGFSKNIFQTVTAEADDVGFGEHYGVRGALFLNRYFGAETSITRTTTEFDFSVSDEEAGVTVFDEPVVQESRELAVALVAQFPLAAMTPYAAVGFSWRTSEVDGAEAARASAPLVGVGMKVAFPQWPVSLAFDYRYVRYPGSEEPLQLAEGGVERSSVSVLTLGVVLRFDVQP